MAAQEDEEEELGIELIFSRRAEISLFSFAFVSLDK